MSGLKERWQDLAELDQVELANPDLVTPFKVALGIVLPFCRERAGQIIGSAFLLIMIWGYHGELQVLRAIWPAFAAPGFDLFAGLAWDRQLMGFLGGAVLLVLVPVLLIKLAYREPLAWYGLGFPPAGRRRLAFIGFLILMGLGAVAAFGGSRYPSMQETYPLYRDFASVEMFLLYELSYFPFFLAIEFIFRGYLLFGLAGATATGVGVSGPFTFHRYALLIQMLGYTAWHLGKPLPELWGTVVWGLFAGAIAYTARSLWPAILAHWLFNVAMDWQILVKTGEWARILAGGR